MIYASEMPDKRVILQVVGKRVDLSVEKEWGSHPRGTKIVAIGKTGATFSQKLDELFNQYFSSAI